MADVEIASLVLTGEVSWGFLRSAAAAVAGALPHGKLRTLPGQSHDIDPVATGNALADFLRDDG